MVERYQRTRLSPSLEVQPGGLGMVEVTIQQAPPSIGSYMRKPTCRTNTILTIPEPHKFEPVERPFPHIKSGYAVIKQEIAPVCF